MTLNNVIQYVSMNTYYTYVNYMFYNDLLKEKLKIYLFDLMELLIFYDYKLNYEGLFLLMMDVKQIEKGFSLFMIYLITANSVFFLSLIYRFIYVD